MNEYQQSWSLTCPSCGLPRNFTTRQGYSYAVNRKSVCNTCSGKRKVFSDTHRRKISQSKMGSKNPMFGRVGFCGDGENNPMFGKVGADHPAYGRKHSDEAVDLVARTGEEALVAPLPELPARFAERAQRGRACLFRDRANHRSPVRRDSRR